MLSKTWTIARESFKTQLNIFTILTLKLGERKFLRNQNLTGDLVCCNTDTIIMRRNLSYRCPDATEKMLIVSSWSSTVLPELKVLQRIKARWGGYNKYLNKCYSILNSKTMFRMKSLSTKLIVNAEKQGHYSVHHLHLKSQNLTETCLCLYDKHSGMTSKMLCLKHLVAVM